jgi:hypothetical protein
MTEGGEINKVGCKDVYDKLCSMSSGGLMAGRKAVTVRILQPRLRNLMRARHCKSQSELINTLLAEEEERLKSHGILRETEGKLKRTQVNDRLL